MNDIIWYDTGEVVEIENIVKSVIVEAWNNSNDLAVIAHNIANNYKAIRSNLELAEREATYWVLLVKK